MSSIQRRKTSPCLYCLIMARTHIRMRANIPRPLPPPPYARNKLLKSKALAWNINICSLSDSVLQEDNVVVVGGGGGGTALVMRISAAGCRQKKVKIWSLILEEKKRGAPHSFYLK